METQEIIGQFGTDEPFPETIPTQKSNLEKVKGGLD